MSKWQSVILGGRNSANELPSAVGVSNLRLLVDALWHETPPTDDSKTNPSFVLGYTGDNLTQIDMTIDGITYRKALSYTGDNLTGVTAWVIV